MRREILFTLLVLTSSAGCIDWNYVENSGKADFSREVPVAPPEGPNRNFLVSIASDFPRLRAAMGNPSDYHSIYFTSSGIDVEVLVGASKDEIARWTMYNDGSITHREANNPIDHHNCLDREPFAIDDAIIARLPQIVADAPRHTSLFANAVNAKLSDVKIRRVDGKVFGCGNVEINVSFEADCGAVYTAGKHGYKFFDCPTSEVVYDTNGKLLRATIDPNVHPYNQ